MIYIYRLRAIADSLPPIASVVQYTKYSSYNAASTMKGLFLSDYLDVLNPYSIHIQDNLRQIYQPIIKG